MDVKPAHCWRCEKPLPARPVSCDRCPKAVYCQDECKQRDKIRHGAVECKMFGLKSCTQCNKTGNLRECSRCNNVWYCDKACQRKNWTDHEVICDKTKVSIKALVPDMSFRHACYSHLPVSFTRMEFKDPPCYFRNKLASDFLRLEDNEWAGEQGEASEGELSRDYHILSAGCGNLGNTVLTAASLPAEYQGKIHITLNDLDPFVMARNVLFLFMLGQNPDSEMMAPSLATIWFSLHISEADYHLIKISLQSLLEASPDPETIRDLSGGLVTVSYEDLVFLNDVWKGWLLLNCERKNTFSINLKKQRQAGIGENKTLHRKQDLFLERLSSKEAASVKKWFQHGLFTPDECNQEDLTFDNPTLTAMLGANRTFVYCIESTTSPLEGWDSSQVKECINGRSGGSVMAMYHAYVTHLLKKMKSLLTQNRLHITILLCNCTEIPERHQSLQLDKYDRIFTSNLADYVGIRTLIKALKPLLNVTNKNAMIITETMNWLQNIYRKENNWDYIKEILQQTQRTMQLCQRDTGKGLTEVGDFAHQMEYYYFIPWFIAYLRAHMMTASYCDPSLDRIPSFKEATQCEGMQMRDFRHELNKLVPFQYRVNARSLSRQTGKERALEWYVLPVNEA